MVLAHGHGDLRQPRSEPRICIVRAVLRAAGAAKWEETLVRRMLGCVAVLAASLLLPAAPVAAADYYRNPVNIGIPSGGRVTSCADPNVIRSQTPGDNAWYMYCTTDPLNNEDKTGSDYNFHLIPTSRSTDLVHWTYVGDAFTSRPTWAEPGAGLWAPEVRYFDGLYHLYFGVTDVKPAVSGDTPECHDDNAIAVATSASPTGPWTVSDAPVVEPRRAFPQPPEHPCDFAWFWTYDPEVIQVHNSNEKLIYYGSYFGGVQARPLSADGMRTDPAGAVQITIPNRYEGTEVIYHGGYYYYLGSASNCCNGPLTGYSVFSGRSTSPTGPFVDRDGVSLLNGRVGGSVFLTMNGNRWVGPGHQSTIEDFDGQWWTYYHAVDRTDPYFGGATGFTRRPVLMDPVDWVNDWPTVRGGRWVSTQRMPSPAAQPGQQSRYEPVGPARQLIRGTLDRDNFGGRTLDSAWSWIREPAADKWSVSRGSLKMDTQDADLYVDNNSASVLVRDLPEGNWMIETKVRLDLPAEGCCFNYVQAGILAYGDDDNFLKLAHVSIWETRQTEWAKEVSPVPDGYPRYGNSVVTAPDEWTWLRIARYEQGGHINYQAYVSRDGIHWNRGGVWTHDMESPQLGLFAMGGSGFQAEFDYVKVYRIRVVGSSAPAV
jgi:arabinan endo-1,5-alpha-L-arabinosidase